MPIDTTRKSLFAGLMRALCALTLLVCAASVLSAASPDQQYSLAADHYQHSRWQLAVVEFDTLLSEHADHRLAAEAKFFAAEASIQLGNYEAAATRLEGFLSEHANHSFAPQAKFRRGECEYFRSRSAAAREQFEAFVKRYPQHELLEFALPYLGELCLTAGEAQAAQAHYQQALEEHPAGRMADQCRFGLAQALEKQGEPAAAERFYRYLAVDTKSTLAEEAKLRLAALLVQQTKHRSATALLEQVLAEGAQGQWHAEASYLLLKTWHAQQKWSEVVALYAKAFAENSEAAHLASAQFLTAEAQTKLGHAEVARRLYRQVIESGTDPTLRNESLIELFKLELAASEHAAAGESLAKLTRWAATDRRLPQMQRMWVVNRISHEEYAAARDYLDELSPQQVERLEPEATYFRGLIALGQREYELALTQLAQIELDRLPASISAPVQFARGSALMNLQRYAAAIEPLEAYLASNPQGADAAGCREYLALALAHENRWTAAAEALTALKRDDQGERYFTITHQLASMALAAEQLELANQWFQELADAKGEAPTALVSESLAALVWLERGVEAKAHSPALSRLLQEFPQSQFAETALLDSAKAAASAGDRAGALAKYQRLLERFPESASAAEGMLGAALIYDRLDQPQEAEAMWSLLVEHSQGGMYRDAALYNLAWSLLAQQREEEAYEQLARLARDFSESKYWVDASLRLAGREHAQQNAVAAQRRLADVLQRELSPATAAHAHYLRGTIAAEQKQWPAVTQAMQQVLAAGNKHPLARAAKYWQAESLYQQRQYEQAEEQLAALAEESAQGEAWEAMIVLRRAQCLAHAKQWKAAEKLVVSIAKVFPDFAQQYEADYLLGRSLAAQARFEEARAAYQRAVGAPLAEGTETAAMASWMIGETYFHGRQYEEALRAYYKTAALSAYPTWRAAALMQAGKCHEVQGEWDKAAQQYTELLAIRPSTRFHDEAEQRRQAARRRVIAQSESTTRTR